MFNKKDFATRKSKSIKVRLDRFDEWKEGADGATVKVGQTVDSYNFATKTGALTAGLGLKKPTLPRKQTENEMFEFDVDATEVRALYPFTTYDNLTETDRYYLFYLDTGNQLCFFDLLGTKSMRRTEVSFNEIPNAAAFKINSDVDTVFFSSPSDKTLGYNNAGPAYYDNIPKFTSGCWHGPYLFMVTVGDTNKLIYSKKRVDIWNYDNVEDVPLPYDIRGGLTKLVSLRDSMYLFRNYGITRLNLYSLKAELSFTNIFESHSYIYPRSISIYGDKIVFLTDEGLFSVEGNAVNKIKMPIEDNIMPANHDCIGVCFNGKYYLACKYDFKDDDKIGEEINGCKNNALIEFDLENKLFEICRGVDISDMTVIQTPKARKLFASVRGEHKAHLGEVAHNGMIFDKPLHKVWKVENLDFGFGGRDKCVTDITIKPGASGKFTIASDVDSQTIDVPLSTRTQRLRTRVFGKTFKILIESDEPCPVISCPELSVKVLL